MEAGTVFAAVSLMMLANGAVLTVISRDLPSALRPAATYWQLGTILIAAGCATFAFGGPLPRSGMLTIANGAMALGLTAYHAAIQRFFEMRPRRWQVVPAALATTCVFWFSAVAPNFLIRLLAISAVWIWLMAASMRTLLRKSDRKISLSQKILIGLFGLVLTYTLARLVIYLMMEPGANFAVESGGNWLNLLSPIFMTVLPVVGTTTFLLMCSDNLRRQLEVAASTDYLTGLPNQRMLAESGKQGFRDAASNGAGFAVAILDIDKFKVINDTHGHEIGDQVLVHVARLLDRLTGSPDVVARSGGEEFAVLLNDCDRGQPYDRIEKMRLAVAQTPFDAGALSIPVTVSAGVAVYQPDDRSFDDMLRRADQALYSAKDNGRNRVETEGPARWPLARQITLRHDFAVISK